MIIVIDGYNVLKQVIYDRKITSFERGQFIAQLGRYARRRGNKIIVVFDGGPSDWLLKEKQHGIQVVYSGVHESADEYIKRYLQEHKAYDLLLVTTDRELNAWGDRLEIPSIDSHDFYQVVQYILKQQGVKPTKDTRDTVKLADQERSEIDQLMEEASQVIPIKAEDIGAQKIDRKSPAKKMSKKERKLLEKLKKL